MVWLLRTNENGWHCSICGHEPGEPPGFSPAHDRELIEIKVHIILMEMHHADLVYISNSGHGESVIAAVVDACHEAGLYDQYSIIGFIMRQLASHGGYWKKISEGVLAGDDPRKRCWCGALATRHVVGGSSFCSLDHDKSVAKGAPF